MHYKDYYEQLRRIFKRLFNPFKKRGKKMSNFHLDKQLRNFLTFEMKNVLLYLDDQLLMQKNDKHLKNVEEKRNHAIKMLGKLKNFEKKEEKLKDVNPHDIF